MAFRANLILGCIEHLLPGQDPNSWECRLAAFRQSPAGHYASLGLQFLFYFGCIMLLHRAFALWRRRGKKSHIPTPEIKIQSE